MIHSLTIRSKNVSPTSLQALLKRSQAWSAEPSRSHGEQLRRCLPLAQTGSDWQREPVPLTGLKQTDLLTLSSSLRDPEADLPAALRNVFIRGRTVSTWMSAIVCS